MDAREAALLTLNTCERQGGWSDGALKKQLAAAGLDLLLPFLLAPFYPGYSHRRQVMSVLGSPESPVRWVYRVAGRMAR